MSTFTFNSIPKTAKELVSLKEKYCLSPEEAIERVYELEREAIKKIEVKNNNTRPAPCDYYGSNPSSKEILLYANAVEEWEKRETEWSKSVERRNEVYNHVKEILKEFIKLESGFYEYVPEKSQDKAYEYVWSRTDFNGYLDAFEELVDFVEIFK